MSHTTYFPDTNHKTADTEQAKQAVAGVGPARSDEGVRGVPGGTDAAGAGIADAPLQRVAAGILGGVPPQQFMDSIYTASQQLGNRAFLHWVGELRVSGQTAQSLADEAAAGPMLPAASRVTASGPLQLMPKKKKKKTAATVEGESEVTTEASGGAGPGADVGVVPADSGGESPVPLPGSEDTPAPAQPEGSAVAGEKKKKKPRVQVALNTLRAEGVEAFEAYIEAEIGETGPLLTLVERIIRAQNLGSIKDAALKAVGTRLRALDPEVGPGITAAIEPRPANDLERPVVAQAKTVLSKREADLFATCYKGRCGLVQTPAQAREH